MSPHRATENSDQPLAPDLRILGHQSRTELKLNLLRCAALECGLHSDAMNECFTPGNYPRKALNDEVIRDVETSRAQNRTLCLAIGFQRVSQKHDCWKLFLRYQAQTERLYRRAVEEFERLRALREELPEVGSFQDGEAACPVEVGGQ